MKFCNGCGYLRPDSEFISKCRQRDGTHVTKRCATCRKARRAWYERAEEQRLQAKVVA